MAKDIKVARVYVEAGACSGGMRTGTLKADLDTNATRYNVRVAAKVYAIAAGGGKRLVAATDVCIREFGPGSPDIILAPVTWECTESLEVRDVLISWQVRDTDYPCDAALPCYTITPKCNYYGAGEEFRVEGSEPPNTPPVAVDDVAETLENTPVLVDVLANDVDPDGDPLEVISVTPPAHGSAEIIGNRVRYTPRPFYFGSDGFSYMVKDRYDATASAFVSVTVVHPNNAPRADAGGPYHGFVSVPLVLDASFSTDPDLRDTLEYRWDLNGDGVWDTDWLSSPRLEHIFDRPYRGLVTVEVRDLYLGIPLDTQDQASAFITILPKPTQIAVTIYVDLNKNSELDEGDVGLPGVSLFLDGEIEVVTGEDGTALVDVQPGTHVVTFSEAGLKWLRDHGFVVHKAEQSFEIESGGWIAIFFSPEARGFLEVELAPKEKGPEKD